LNNTLNLYRFNLGGGAHTIAGGSSNGSRGAEPPESPLTLTTDYNLFHNYEMTDIGLKSERLLGISIFGNGKMITCFCECN